MKTIAQVVKEYNAKVNAKDFEAVTISENNGRTSDYTDVTNLHNTEDENGTWLEFDYESFTLEKTMHVKLHGHVIKTVVGSE